MSPERLIHLLDRHEEGTLSAIERQELHELMEEEHAEEISALHRQLVQEIIHEGRSRLAQSLEQWEQEIPHEGPMSQAGGKVRAIPYLGGILALAAAVTLLVLIVMPKQTNPQAALFQELGAPYPNTLLPLERGESKSSDLQEAFAEYESGHYGAFLSQLSDLDTSSQAIDFYRANAYLALDQFQDAASIFQRLAYHTSAYSEQAEWYEAMAAVRMQEEEKALGIIREIAAQPEHEMHKRAQNWLKALK